MKGGKMHTSCYTREPLGLRKCGTQLRISPLLTSDSLVTCSFFQALEDDRILCLEAEVAETITEDFFGAGSLVTAPICPPYTTIQAVQTGGRNAAWFTEHALFSGVVRQYRRGGMISKLSQSYYVWQGAEKTRSWEEFKILCYLYAQGVPVAKPIAAMYRRQGFFYQAALLTERIEGAITLIEAIQHLSAQEGNTLSQLPVENNESPKEKKLGTLDALAKEVAQVIYRMHACLVNHADLNAFNILVDSSWQYVYLIDFDKAHLERSMGDWCQINYSRLARHLTKVLGEEGERFMLKIKENIVT